MGLRQSLRAIHSMACFALDAVWFAGRRKAWTGDRVRRLLLVRVDRIGDFVLWMPAARALIGHYGRQGYVIVIIVSAECRPLAARLEGIGEILTLDRDAFRLNPAYRIGVLAQVRGLGAELAVQPTYSRIPSLGDAIVRASGAETCIGWTGDRANATVLEKFWGDRAYTRLLPNPADASHELQRNEAFLDALGVDHEAVADDSTAGASGQGGGEPRGDAPYFVLLPGAGSALRQWPARNFAVLADRLHDAYGWRGVICGGPADTAIARQVVGHSAAPLRDMTGQTDLDRLQEVLAAAELVIGNESGPVHIAASVSVPCVCILGGGHFGRFVPYVPTALQAFRPPRPAYHQMPCFGCDWKCRFRPFGRDAAPCIEGITIDAVWTAIGETLADSPSSSAPLDA